MKISINNVNLGVQSYCYREIPELEDVIKGMQVADLDTLEICGCHINVKDPESCKKVLSLCDKYGITLSTMGVDGYSARDKEGAIARFEFAKNAGMKFLAADPDMDAESVDFLENLCEKTGIRLMVHNHGDYHRYGKFEQLDALFAAYSKNLGLHLDTGWSLQAKIDPTEMGARYIDRLYGVHLKDFKFDENHKFEEAFLGEGALDLKSVLKMVETAPEIKVMSIEYEGTDAVESVRKCAENIAKAL